MVRTEVFLDNNATTRPLPAVRDAMLRVLGDDFGNPSSVHSGGSRGREHLRIARQSVGDLIGVSSDHVLFTSSGTEANNWIIESIQRDPQPPCRLVTTSAEHSSILKACDALQDSAIIVRLPIGESGRICLEDLQRELTQKTALVSVHWVNNETGIIQPIREISQLCQSLGIPFHTDAAQAVGKLPVDLTALKIDFLTLTGHKIHAPQGVGAIYARDPQRLKPIFHGGEQGSGFRPGTENVPGIVGLGKAAALRDDKLEHIIGRLTALRDLFEEQIFDSVPDVFVNGDPAHRVCNTSNLQFAGVDGQALVARLDQHGIRCSQSSACTNRRPEPSYVLRAMGLSEEAAWSSVRFGFSVENTVREVEFAIDKISELCRQLRRFRTGPRSYSTKASEV